MWSVYCLSPIISMPCRIFIGLFPPRSYRKVRAACMRHWCYMWHVGSCYVVICRNYAQAGLHLVALRVNRLVQQRDLVWLCEAYFTTQTGCSRATEMYSAWMIEPFKFCTVGLKLLLWCPLLFNLSKLQAFTELPSKKFSHQQSKTQR